MSQDADRQNDELLREVVALRARVTELQRAAARYEEADDPALAEREELLRDAERVAHLGTWTWDVQSGRVTWSAEMYRILGIEPGSVTPSVENFLKAIHPEDGDRVRARVAHAQQQGVLPLADCRVVRPDGSIRRITTSGSFLFDAEGKVQRVVGGVLDRTDSVEAESKLRRTLALLEEAQHFAQLGSWRFDPETQELEWSKEFARIAGLPPDTRPTVEGFVACLVPEDRTRFLARHERNVKTPEDGQIDGRLQRPDGTLRNVRLKWGLVTGAHGRQELRGTMLDITDQVKMREELAHSQKMEAVGRLAGGIAHDFNNLLTIVIGNLELLGKRMGDCREVEDSLRALDSAENLTRRLLAFGRKAQLSLKLVDPNELVRSTTSLMQRLVGDHVKLKIELAANTPRILADPLELERALVNLVVNAKNVMPDGGVIQISTGTFDDGENSWVKLTVADQGPGIKEAHRLQIFEPFFTTRGGVGGNGLGLATVLGTAEQHGGTVEVESREGKGSRFTILLPANEAKTSSEDTQPKPRPDTQDRQALELLVVDDEPQVAKVTRRMLISRGHRVHMACSPTEASELWKEHGKNIDLIICDVVMPEMRGPQLIQQLEKSGRPPNVLFMSGYSEETNNANLGHPVLAKPFSISQLEQAVDDAVDLTHASADAAG